jgi:hypothetical protein
MARTGTNPMKWIDENYQPQNITITTIVYIPYLEGYWEKSLDVLELCMNSISASIKLPFDLMVFDNGSCCEVQNYLTEKKNQGKIQYLILSDKNLGKVGAWNIIFSAAQGEIIVYTDSDVLFFNGWLDKSLSILDAFPKAGMVTAQPARGRPDFYEINSTVLADAPNDPTIRIRKGKLISDEILGKVRLGLGYSEEYYQKNNLDPFVDVELSKDNKVAYVSASHFQFLSKKSILQQLIPFKGDKAYGGDTQLDRGMNNLGYWSLSTKDYLVHHIGNNPSDVLLDSASEAEINPAGAALQGLDSKASEKQNQKRESVFYTIMRYFLKRTGIRIIVKKINVVTYKLLSTKR